MRRGTNRWRTLEESYTGTLLHNPSRRPLPPTLASHLMALFTLYDFVMSCLLYFNFLTISRERPPVAPWIDFVRFFQKPPFRLGPPPPQKGLFQIDASVHSGARWFVRGAEVWKGGKRERESRRMCYVCVCVCVYIRF